MARKMEEKKDTRVKAVSERETVVTSDMDITAELERRISSEEIENLRDQRLSLNLLIEHIINNAIKRQQDASKNSLTISVTFDLIDQIIIVQDDSVGLSLEDFSSLVLESRFGTMIEDDKRPYREDLSLLELAVYLGEEFELLTVSEAMTKWVTINFNDVLNLEQVDMVPHKNEKNARAVKKLVPSTGVRYVIRNQVSTYEAKKDSYATSPYKFHQLREHLRDTFEDIMEEMDLVINLNYRSKIQKRKKGIFRRK